MNNKFIEQDSEKYLMLDDPKEYLLAHQSDALVGSKFANITARQGFVGEVINTVMKNGHNETTNVVSYDTVTGQPDWVVTQASGEDMIVSDSKFRNLYQMPDGDIEGKSIKPSGKYRPMIKINENVAIMTSWGEIQYIKKGGVLVAIESNDIYGIQKAEFEGSYNVIKEANAQSLLIENLNIVSVKNKPQIFLSVAYPYDNETNQNLMESIIKYLNFKGLKVINIRNISEKSNHLVKDISNALRQSDGILSLAFNKGNGMTSPFIQIETALACLNSGLAQLMILPKDVRKEGILDQKNMLNTIEVSSDKEFNDKDNEELRNKLDEFIDDVTKRFKLKINEKDLSQFKKGIILSSSKNKTQKDVVNFLKNFYKIKDKDFDFSNVYIKRPTQIKATIIDNDGYYETQDGVIYLRKGDFLVQDIDGKSRPYGVSEKEFKNRYVKVNGEEDTYVSKLIPTIANEKNGKMEVYNLVSPDDVYSVDKEKFKARYQSFEDYILSLEDIENDNIQEL